jgi:succinyl-CoA synthetase alpha subunit
VSKSGTLTYEAADQIVKAAKMRIMRECGLHVVESPAEIGETMVKVLAKK